MSHPPTPASPSVAHTVRRWWWLPVLVAVLGAATAVVLGSTGDPAEDSGSTAVVQLDTTDGAINSASEHALVISTPTRERASAALADDRVLASASELLGRSTVRVDAVSGAVHITVTGSPTTDTVVANALADSYVEERTIRHGERRDARAQFLAEQSSTLTRDLLAANLLMAQADEDDRDRDRLESRVLALELERDRLELEAQATDDIERQLAALRGELDGRTPAVEPVELARAQASADLSSAQLEEVRSELSGLTAPAVTPATLIEPASRSISSGAAGVDSTLLIALTTIGLLLGLATVGFIHLVSSPRADVSPLPLSDPLPRLAPNAVTPPDEPPPASGAGATATERLEAMQPIVPKAPVGPTVSEPISLTAPARPHAGVNGKSKTTSTAIEPEAIANIPAPPPDHTHPVTINHPDSDAGRAYTALAALLVERAGDHTTPAVSFIGPGTGVGRTTVAVNVAAAAAEAGHQTLLVSPLWEEIEIPGLPVLPPGLGISEPEDFPPPTEFRAALDDVAALVDIVFIDTEPSDLHPETAALAAATNLTAIVVMAGRSNIAAVSDLADDLAAAGANVAGLVVNAHEIAVSL